MDGGEVGDEASMRERRVWRILNYLSTACEMQSLIVWMVAGMSERETARKAMSRWRELRAMITLAFFVALPTKTGRVGGVFCM